MKAAYLRQASVLGVLLLCSSVASGQDAAGTPVRVRGTIEGVADQSLSIKTIEGDSVTIALPEQFPVGVPTRVVLKDVKADSYVGVAAVPADDGGLNALEMQIFPEAFRGAAEGHYSWDLAPDSNMTNGNLAEIIPQGNDRLVHVEYQGGSQDIVVPADTPVWTFELSDRSALMTGAYAVVGTRKLADGTYTGEFAFVEKDGVRPAN